MYYEFDYKLQKSTLLFALGGWLKEKIGQIRSKSKWEEWTNEWGTAYYFLYNFLKYTN